MKKHAKRGLAKSTLNEVSVDMKKTVAFAFWVLTCFADAQGAAMNGGDRVNCMKPEAGAVLFAERNGYADKLKSLVPQIIAKSAAHYRALDAAATPLMWNKNGKPMIPRGFDHEQRTITMDPIQGWRTGHYPGSLWYLYEATGDAFFMERAIVWTELLEPNRHLDRHHDVGFIIMCSFGNARRIMKTDKYDSIIVDAAKALSRRYSDSLGVIRSWGKVDDAKDFLVIPDNMMNLELLTAAERLSGEERFGKVARSHASVTMKNHFRSDGGTYHVLNYSQKDGRIQEIRRGQGASCFTAWSRGQSWAIYGYTMMYRETGDRAYLDFARKVSDYAINHPNMPEDGIPYWDFGAPGEERDSSAGAVMAAGLIELSKYVDPEIGRAYLAFAAKQLLSLASPAYFSEGDEVGHYLLKHGVGNKPGGSEIDTPLNYGDYYFLEALVRFADLAGK